MNQIQSKKVKVTIALAIDEDGYWKASGSNEFDDPEDAMAEVIDSMYCTVTNRYIIETEVEIPEVKNIKDFAQIKM